MGRTVGGRASSPQAPQGSGEDSRLSALAGSFDIRLAVPAEYAEVGELTLGSYVGDGHLGASDHYAATLRDAASRAEQAELWVAAERPSGRLLGTVTFCPPGSPYRELASEGEGEFRMLAVDPAARRRGVARALTRHCLARSSGVGLADIVLCSLPTMTAAHSLYASLGFVRDPVLDWEPAPGVVLWGFRTASPRPDRDSVERTGSARIEPHLDEQEAR